MITASVEIDVSDIRPVVDYKGAPEWELTAMVPWSKHPISPKLYLKREEGERDSPWDFPAKYKALVGRGDLLKDKDTGESKSGDLVWNYRYKLLEFPLSDDAPLSQTTNWYKDIFCVQESQGYPPESSIDTHKTAFPKLEGLGATTSEGAGYGRASESSIDPVVQAIEGDLVEDVLEEEKSPNPYGRQPTADYRQAQIMYQAARHDAIPLICTFPDSYLTKDKRHPNDIRKAVLKLTNAIFREYWEDMIKPRFPDTVWEETL